MQLKNKVSIVTGAKSGIGLAIAQRFAVEGSKVVFAFSGIPVLPPNFYRLPPDPLGEPPRGNWVVGQNF